MKKMEPTKLCCFSIIAISMVVAVHSIDESSSLSLPGCNNKCGNITIPYPFGIGNSSIPNQTPCFLEPIFNLTCENNTKLYSGKVEVLNIDILKNQLELSFFVSEYCDYNNYTNSWLETTAGFTISRTKNKFITVGCDSYGNRERIENGTCSGIGCCQMDIPPSMRNITITTSEFPNSTESFGDCSYSFVVKQDSYNFSATDLYDFPHKELPLILDWSVGEENCKGSNGGSACRNNSYCDDEDIDFGYRCRCNKNYEGNPYHPDGCKDIDECKLSDHNCIDENHCRNIDGSFECFCPEGQSGNGTKEGGGCHRPDIILKVTIGTRKLIKFVGISLLILIYQKRKLIKLKEKFFEQNGGFILLQQLSTREDSSRNAQIYTEEQLKKATNNFDQSRIIGKGGFGTVFKGFLRDNRTVAIKKSKIIDSSQVNQFINEVVVLSQINHRNVVKLLGCCLETEVPLLVYEFVSNGTLLDFIHSKDNENNILWKTRMRIAAETAGALSYLHSSASIPIIHRDVKSANILLDDSYTAKVSDFGASRLIPLDQTEIATVVQAIERRKLVQRRE